MKRFASFFLISIIVLMAGCGQNRSTLPISGTYQVNSDASTVRFTSIKNKDLAVTGRFSTVKGTITVPDDGKISQAKGSMKLDLSSLNTGLDIRNKRIIETFFQVPEQKSYRYATFTFSSVNSQANKLEKLHDPIKLSVSGTMKLVGKKVKTTIPLKVTRTGQKTIRVTSQTPWVLSIKEFGLEKALDALMKVCGHNDVSDAVPLSFDLQLRKRTK
ncbi:MAG: YceI family protein [bacterium]